MTKNIIQDKLYIARREANLSQELLARKISANGTNVSTRTIVRIEKTGKINLFLLEKISEVLKKPITFFITNDEENAGREKYLESLNHDGFTCSATCPSCKHVLQIEVQKNNEVFITGVIKQKADRRESKRKG